MKKRSFYAFALLLCFFSTVICKTGMAQNLKISEKENGAIASSDSITDQNLATYKDPNTIPYSSRRNVAEHIFSLPAKIWHLLWLPVGESVIWIEQNHIHQQLISLFFNKDFTGAIFPIVNVGGNMGFAGGVMAFHNNLFNKGKSINFNFLIGSLDDNYTTIAYADKSLLGSPIKLNLLAQFVSDSDENLYLGGNKGTKDDETSYDYEEGKIQIGLSYDLIKQLNWRFLSQVKHVDIAQGEEEEGELFPTDIAGFGTTKLWTVGSTITFNLRNGWPRTLSGTLFRFGYQFNSQLSENRFRFYQYSVELQQFLSPPFLEKNRRFSFRTRLEKRQEMSDKDIPFYELSMLGTADDLRGFDQNRFRAKGSLLVNFEYRYPIWDTWDAVIFFDEGQVFNKLSEIGMENLHWGAGAGLRFMTRTGFLFRLEAGFSKEQLRVLFEMKPNF